MGFHDAAFLPSRVSFPPNFLKIVVGMKALGPPHVFKLWLLLLWSHRRSLKMILSRASDAHRFIKGPPQAEALTLCDEGRASEP